MPSNLKKGRAAETRAVAYLRDLGYTIITRNYFSQWAELDVVALDGEEIVFVEVRYRADGTGMFTISEKKRDSLLRAMDAYVEEMQETRSFRFELIAVTRSEIQHIRDFELRE
jgi:putative endonuclease